MKTNQLLEQIVIARTNPSIWRKIQVFFLKTQLRLLAEKSSDAALYNIMAKVWCDYLVRIAYEHTQGFELSYVDRRFIGTNSQHEPFYKEYSENKTRWRHVSNVLQTIDMVHRHSSEETRLALRDTIAELNSHISLKDEQLRNRYEAMPYEKKLYVTHIIDKTLVRIIKHVLRNAHTTVSEVAFE